MVTQNAHWLSGEDSLFVILALLPWVASQYSETDFVRVMLPERKEHVTALLST